MSGHGHSIVNNEKGFALVLVLLIVALLIAAVTDFAYTVHQETVSLYHWRDAQSLSLEAASGLRMGEQFLVKYLRTNTGYTYPGRVDIPVPDVTQDGRDSMVVSITDECGKINLNKVVDEHGGTETTWHYQGFKRLLQLLGLDETIAGHVADWIDTNHEERVRGSEKSAKNGPLYSIDELKNIHGITEDAYKKLLPHVTIFGDGNININSADQYVLMSLSDDINEGLAKRAIAFRELKPFQEQSGADIRRVSGFSSTLVSSLMGRISVKGTAFSLSVVAMREEMRKTVTAVVEYNNNKLICKYWKEY
ncbi:MAG: general secretion pathway protein GspK [bacterium]